MSKQRNKRTSAPGVPNAGQHLAQRQAPAAGRAAAQFQATVQTYTGPLPHPDILARYEEIVPGSSRLLVEKFVQQTDHRMALERLVIAGDERRAYLGLGAAFVIAMGGLALAYILVTKGHAIEGAIFGGFDFAALVATFVYGTNARRQEREGKVQRVQKR